MGLELGQKGKSYVLLLIIASVCAVVPPIAVSNVAGAEGPVISEVSPITDERLQTITIRGTGFGDVQPQVSYLSDGSVSMVGSSDSPGAGGTPVMRVQNLPMIGEYWQAGVSDLVSMGSCVIGIFLAKWSDTEIILGGFGDGLVRCSQWNLNVGDQMRFTVITTEGYTAYRTTTIAGSGTPPPTSSDEAPVITSVTPITATRLQTIVITGSGFGDIQPVLMTLGDGSVNTVGSGKNMPGDGTPVLKIEDLARNEWTAGVRDSPSSGACAIGLYLEKWSDTEIVLGGFGTALSTSPDAHWTIQVGDPLLVRVFTEFGAARYDLTVVDGSDVPPYSYPNSTLPTPVLNVSCRSSSTLSDFRAEISGSLTYYGYGLSGVPVLLSYSVDGGKAWKELTLVNTDGDGEFVAVWLLSVTGNYFLKAECEGESEYAGTSAVISFVVTPSADAKNLISVASTSTVSAFAFNSTSGILAFDVSGPSGTIGQVQVYVPKTLVADAYNLQVFLDGNILYYDVESVGDSWLITFTYTHSTHKITVNLNNTTVNANQLTQIIASALTAPLALTIAVLVIKKKRN